MLSPSSVGARIGGKCVLLRTRDVDRAPQHANELQRHLDCLVTPLAVLAAEDPNERKCIVAAIVSEAPSWSGHIQASPHLSLASFLLVDGQWDTEDLRVLCPS